MNIYVYIYTFATIATIAATATIAAIAAIAAIATMRLLQLLQLLQLFALLHLLNLGPRASWAGFAYARAHFAYAKPTRKLPTQLPARSPLGLKSPAPSYKYH